ncbi:MAG TPA: AsmA family protein, partial [Rudaea sp.]
MAKGFRRLLVVLGSIALLMVVLVLAVVVFVAAFDWNGMRPVVAQRVSSALGRQVTIDGNLDVGWRRDTTGRVHHWLPRLHVSASGVTVANAPWSKQKTFATCDDIDFDLLLLPLLRHELFLGSIHMKSPVAHLERRADGSSNWTFGATPDHPSGWRLRLGRVVFDSGKFDIDDQVRKLHADIAIEPLSGPIDFESAVREQEKRALALSTEEVGRAAGEHLRNHARGERRPTTQRYAFAWKVSGRLGGAALSGNGHVGGVLGFQNDEEPWPVRGELNAGTTHVAWIGTLTNPTDISALDLRLWLIGASMADLYPLLGVALPET